MRRRALITGSTSAIGRETTLLLARAGDVVDRIGAAGGTAVALTADGGRNAALPM